MIKKWMWRLYSRINKSHQRAAHSLCSRSWSLSISKTVWVKHDWLFPLLIWIHKLSFRTVSICGICSWLINAPISAKYAVFEVCWYAVLVSNSPITVCQTVKIKSMQSLEIWRCVVESSCEPFPAPCFDNVTTMQTMKYQAYGTFVKQILWLLRGKQT